MKPNEALQHATPSAIAASFGIWLVRNFGADTASQLADIVVSTVQKEARNG